MLAAPDSSPSRPVFDNRTNNVQRTLSFLPTPPRGIKRPCDDDDAAAYKRAKLETSSGLGQPGVELLPLARGRLGLRPGMNGHGRRLGLNHFSRPFLESFVCSVKNDVYVCQAEGLMCPPLYASAYSHGSKRGGASLLAVATEFGGVHILNTARRDPWDPEPLRINLQPHNNGVFDVQWSTEDDKLATGSADQLVQISDIASGSVTATLRGHTSTVKSVRWDPTNNSLLATGGKDGSIHLWDLRVGTDTTTSPVASIFGAQEEIGSRKRPASLKSVTGLLYSTDTPYNLISSGTADGLLRCWDIRLLQRRKSGPKPKPVVASGVDPTCLQGSRRPRGIKSICLGTGPTAGSIFGFSADSRIHVYSLDSLAGQENCYFHPKMQTNSFYVGLALNPNGNWLACGGPDGNAFVFDVHNAASVYAEPTEGVRLGMHGQSLGEVGAVSWSVDGLATCLDEGTVRVWRPDLDVYRECQADPEGQKWHWDWSM
ncbi:WD40 repeat-like protein [Cylindrobasidium torrendii FP15055 ss-10]|uniref:WD40 repeat-like protein n=1 Tax=Cylindrobasidium torrendii FP15055 ss-10 TaxID=1314674 RepID=A0A0D7BH04_9AGAR|nr:WD40 repeat-like protein [Cylindrobasidium torrendii FP15055 ss-10]